MYTEDSEEVLPQDQYSESELKDIDTMYMGTKSEARKRFQRNGQYRRQSFQRLRSSSRDSCYSGPQRQSCLEGPRRDSRDDHSHY